MPAGSPVMWYADKMPYAPLLDVWARAQRQQDTTGLRPILRYADVEILVGLRPQARRPVGDPVACAVHRPLACGA
ncbi:hypothetical protein [Streptomyces sp. NBC_00151]|uniref:hypothetical protein n=1 Tax=Streptomyces sp. NBC_00151 TaxID=2975669 RepID=UPI002DD8DF97|nr:hypothetical protein [Streptomyces sp. NBC_00151]WRZ41257.1 hypothetical protein OG915_26385 [Streptomyces sp. NBC_00151]